MSDRQAPRQPRDLQGLLRFAMEATRAEDAPNESHFREMSPERRQFLEDALKSMTVDVIEALTRSMNVLIEGTASCTEQVDALEVVTDFVENMDTANDFYKIGGFCVLLPGLRSTHAEVRAGTCELIATLAQNNPFCQKHLVELQVFTRLFELLTDSGENVAPRAMHAISCIARGEEECASEFFKLGGVECLLGTLDTGNERLIIRAAFLMSALSSQDARFRKEFLDLGAIEKLFEHLRPTTEYDNMQESVLQALFNLVDSNHVPGDLKPRLHAIKEACGDKDEFQEVIGYVDGIMDKCFGQPETPDR